MKLQLKKQALVNLTDDNQVVPAEVTPQIGGGNGRADAQSNYVTYQCSVGCSEGCYTQNVGGNGCLAYF